LPPCIRRSGYVTTGVIWFDDDASGCPLRA
jgi:hypothetical protein